MTNYPLIADHGLIGDLQTAALVSRDGAVDWFCTPRFDSPSIFGALLDQDRGGACRIRPVADVVESRQMYFPDTAILITRFFTEDAVGEIVDFMPVLEDPVATDRHRLVRTVRCVRGEMHFRAEIAPRFDYGRVTHELTVTDHGGVFASAAGALCVHIVREPDDERLADVRVIDSDAEVTFVLRAGQTRGLVLDTGFAGPPAEIRPAEIDSLFEQTVRFWRGWIAQSTYRGRWREMLERSAITLKLMTYLPSGGLVAAPTAGLPEQLGGERNWDYRYTWIRDASLSVSALLGMGFTTEAAAFSRWLAVRVREQRGSETGPLNIMYRIDGSADLAEETLDHWEGYRGSTPVRIGNGAAGQLQLDIYGEALDSVYLADRHGLQVGLEGWRAIERLLSWLGDHWDQPEEGIWETRGGRKDFTYGRLMTWVAFDRGIRIAESRSKPGPVETWRRERDEVFHQITQRGWSEQRGAFVQHYDDTVLDASLLRMPTVGFIAATDPLWASTLDAMEGELVTDSLVYRYDPGASPDGLAGSEGTFSLCSFLYVNALARAGRLDAARLTFEKMLTYANHVGLYAEEIADNGQQIGNFPQAFTHLALIDAALVLNARLDQAVTR